MDYFKKRKEKNSSLWPSIARMLLVGWALPVAIMIFIMIYFVDARDRKEVANTAYDSLESVSTLIDMQIEESVVSSKNASYYGGIRDAYEQYTVDNKESTFTNIINNFLGQQYKYNEHFDSAVLIFLDEDFELYTYNNSTGATYKNVESFIKNSKDTIIELSKELDTSTRIIAVDNRVFLIRNLVKSSFEPYAVLCLEMNKDSLFEGIKSVWGYTEESIYINGNFIYGKESINPEAYLITKEMLRYDAEISIAVGLDTASIFARSRATWNLFYVIIAAMLPIIIGIFYYFKHGVSEKIYKEEIALRDARIMALQSQINPHFLNNTLEIINWEARLNENYKVSSMIESLSTMLEATMNRKESRLGTITDEIAYVDAYLYIISQRLGERFSFKKDIDESLLGIMIPRLVVQPIVENAVEHGVSKTRGGEIDIRLFKEDGYIVIEVENDAELLPEDKENVERLLYGDIDVTAEMRVSLGIRNVNRRLKLTYGPDCGLTITGNDKKHTVSRIKIKENSKR